MQLFLRVVVMVLGGVLSTYNTPLLAQPTLGWQKMFGEAPGTMVGLARLYQLHPNRLLGVGGIHSPGSVAVDKSTLWVFNGQGDTIRSRSYALKNGGYLNVLPLAGGNLQLTGYGDTTTIPNSYDTALFYVKADSLGNWLSRPRYLPTYGSAGGATPLLPLPAGGALWCQMVYLYAYQPFPNRGYATTAQVVRLDSAQHLVWQRQYGGMDAGPTAMAMLLDGSYVLIGSKARGYQPLTGGSAFTVVSGWAQRLKANGDTIRLPEFFGNSYEKYEPQDVQPTPDGGYLVAGTIYPDKYVPVFNCCPVAQGWLAKFDSVGVMQWEQRVPGRSPQLPGCRLGQLQVLASGGAVVTGERGPTTSNDPNKGYLACYVSTGNGGAHAVWETYFLTGTGQQQTPLSASGELLLSGQLRLFRTTNGVTDLRFPGVLTRFASVGMLYTPDYCQHPPSPNAGFGLNARRDTLRVVDFSRPGPRYAQIERWRWHYSDGTFYEGATPPPHRYASPPAPGAAVTLTVTNNLGCSATQVFYPFGVPTAAAQVRALANQPSLYPNPTTAGSGFTLTLTGLPASTKVQLSLCDGLGRAIGGGRTLVANQEGTATQFIPLGGISAGIYLARIQTERGSFVKKLVVE